jgi:TolB protein
MIDGKKFLAAHKAPRDAAQNVADFIWGAMMGRLGSFSSKIAYCRQKIEKKRGKDRVYKQILLSEIDGSNERILIDLPTVSFAPRWNQNPEVPVLFYSENTLSNVRLMMSNMFGKRRVVCSFDGLNMQPAFSEDGNEIVFCLSKDGSSQLYRSYLSGGGRKYIRLTHNKSNNFAPCFVDKKTIVFVSDYKTRSPQIYFMDIKTQEITPITSKGYNACPSYCKAKNQIVYSKMMSGKMQLFVYDCASKKHEQVTKGSTFSNEEPTWSPCGNFIAYCANEGFNGRIARLNMVTKRKSYITPKSWNCSYPSWSPVYSSWLQ